MGRNSIWTLAPGLQSVRVVFVWWQPVPSDLDTYTCVTLFGLSQKASSQTPVPISENRPRESKSSS